MPLMDLMQAARRAGVSATQATDLRTARAAAEAWARQHHGVVVLAGSLVLAGMVLAECNVERGG
jgi:hypothetical protein